MRWMNSATWEPVPVETDGQALVGDMIFVSPEMPSTFDFNAHLQSSQLHIKQLAGLGDFQRGEVKNIRTAAEANMIEASVQGRLNVRLRILTKYVKRGFDKAADVLRWAAANPEASGIDMDLYVKETQADVDASVLMNDILEHATKFRILPFSPLMEDKHVRREQLVGLIGQLASSPSVEEIDWKEITRELIDLFGVRPSVVRDNSEAEEPVQEQPIPMPAMGGLPFG